MTNFIFNIINEKIKKNSEIKNKKILVAGLTYKPNVSDLRNSLAIKIYQKLKKKFINIKGYDPIIDKNFAKKMKIETNFKKIKNSDIVIFLVNHKIFKKNIKYLKKYKTEIIDPFLFFKFN